MAAESANWLVQGCANIFPQKNCSRSHADDEATVEITPSEEKKQRRQKDDDEVPQGKEAVRECAKGFKMKGVMAGVDQKTWQVTPVA